MDRALEIETPLGQNTLLLLAVSGHEGLSTLGQFDVALKSKRNDIDASKMLGQNVTIQVETIKGKPARYFNGFITRWSGVSVIRDSLPGGQQTRAYQYDATISPWLWFLTRRANSRIFQNQTVPEIVEAIFKGHRALASFKNALKGQYRSWPYCVQYRETDFNFVSRLMEQEGIYYWVEHARGKHIVNLVDDVNAHKASPWYDTVSFAEEDQHSTEVVSQWQGTHEIQPGRYVAGDYNYETPKTSLEDQAERKVSHPHGDLEYYEFPAEVDDPGEARAAARVRIDELHSQHHTFAAGGNLRGLYPGCSFKLDRHPVPTYNDKYLVVTASYQSTCNADSSGMGGSFSFQCSFSAIPLKQQYRPPRVTPKPVVQGPQTAVVVGQSGKEIETDNLGRIKVQFHWDRYGQSDQDSSCWIRVSQPWAGKGWGALAVPRIGQEVVVGFIEGDPDLPLVIGRVYNPDQSPPFGLPQGAVISGVKSRTVGGSGHNEMSMDDTAGKEKLHLHAQFDMDTMVLHDQTSTVKHNRTDKIDVDDSLTVDGNRTITVKGKQTTTVTGDRSAAIKSNDSLTVDGKIDESSKGDFSLTSDTNLKLTVGGSVVHLSPTAITLSFGGSTLTVDASGIALVGPKISLNG